jgi:peptidoglycan/xylan/chitin deacetylase (PgdA/CDA1 family)
VPGTSGQGSPARLARSHRTSLRGRIVTARSHRPPILMYHAVGLVADDPFDLFVSPERFRRQMATLVRLGLRGVSLRELGDALVSGRADGQVAITFDDGYRDTMRYAPPVLDRYGFTATFFVVAGALGGENRWDPPPRRKLMTEDDVRELATGGHEIGSHSVSHPRLAGLAPDALRREVADSRTALAQVLGAAPGGFCYPYGSVDAAAVNAVVDAGYSHACAVRRVPGLPELFALPRIGMSERDSSPRLMARILRNG